MPLRVRARFLFFFARAFRRARGLSSFSPPLFLSPPSSLSCVSIITRCVTRDAAPCAHISPKVRLFRGKSAERDGLLDGKLADTGGVCAQVGGGGRTSPPPPPPPLFRKREPVYLYPPDIVVISR